MGGQGFTEKHHAFGDKDGDPHSPKKGFFRSWFHFFNPKIVEQRFIKDLLNNPIVKISTQMVF